SGTPRRALRLNEVELATRQSHLDSRRIRCGTHETVMVELGAPSKLINERLGHEDGSVQACYSHGTPRCARSFPDFSREALQTEPGLGSRRRSTGPEQQFCR